MEIYKVVYSKGVLKYTTVVKATSKNDAKAKGYNYLTKVHDEPNLTFDEAVVVKPGVKFS
jgi:hypothetical protein